VTLLCVDKTTNNVDVFNEVLTLFVGKYGKVDIKQTDIAGEAKIWLRKSGQIEFNLMPGPPSAICMIIYTPIDEEREKI
jgi:hypothetical protein